MTTKVRNLSVILAVFAVPWAVATVRLSGRATRPQQGKNISAGLETDAAYRDAIFLGELDARQGRSPKPSVGRWNTEKDRASFKVGYEKGYREALKSKNSQPGR